jgi:transposase
VPRPRIAMRKIRDVLRLSLGEQLSRRQISASLGIPLSTLADCIGRAKLAGLSWPLPDEMDDAALERVLYPPPAPSSVSRPMPDWGYIHTELRKKAVTLQLLWIEYREEHPEGLGYSQFCNLYGGWRKKVDVVMRQHHRAGEKMFVDFPGMTIPIYDRSSGAVSFEAELFVSALGASGYLYAEAVRSQELLYWVTAHIHALEFYGGSPEISVPDNLRSAVTKAHRYEPDVNATYSEMAAHYGMAIIPALLRITEIPHPRSLKFPTSERSGGPLEGSAIRMEGPSMLAVTMPTSTRSPCHVLSGRRRGSRCTVQTGMDCLGHRPSPGS